MRDMRCTGVRHAAGPRHEQKIMLARALDVDHMRCKHCIQRTGDATLMCLASVFTRETAQAIRHPLQSVMHRSSLKDSMHVRSAGDLQLPDDSSDALDGDSVPSRQASRAVDKDSAKESTGLAKDSDPPLDDPSAGGMADAVHMACPIHLLSSSSPSSSLFTIQPSG